MKESEIEELVEKYFSPRLRKFKDPALVEKKNKCLAYCRFLNSKKVKESIKDYAIKTAALLELSGIEEHLTHYFTREKSLRKLKAENRLSNEGDNKFFLENYEKLITLLS